MKPPFTLVMFSAFDKIAQQHGPLMAVLVTKWATRKAEARREPLLLCVIGPDGEMASVFDVDKAGQLSSIRPKFSRSISFELTTVSVAA